MDFYCHSCCKFKAGVPALITNGARTHKCAECVSRLKKVAAFKHQRRAALRKNTRPLRSDYIDYLARI